MYTVPQVRLQQVKERTHSFPLNDSRAVATLIQKVCGASDRECFVVVCLDTHNLPTSIEIVTMGSVNQCPVHPREVFKLAILSNAAAIILGHNHPSGDSTPSEADYAVTGRLVECGNLLGIHLLDHVIVGDSVFYSFKSRGLLP